MTTLTYADALDSSSNLEPLVTDTSKSRQRASAGVYYLWTR